MKTIFGFALIALSFSSLATTDSETFIYDGSQETTEFTLLTKKTHPETRLENVISTCEREEVRGQRTVCMGESIGSSRYRSHYREPYYGGPYHRPYPSAYYRQCYSEPMKVTVQYQCFKPIKVTTNVFDYDVNAKVKLSIKNASPDLKATEKFRVDLVGDEIVFTAEGSKKFFLLRSKKEIKKVMSGSVMLIDADLEAKLIEAAPLMKSIQMGNVSIEDSILNINMGEIEKSKISYSLTISKTKAFGAPFNIFSRELMDSEVEFKKTTFGSVAAIDLAKLGVNLDDGKYSLVINALPKFQHEIMNDKEMKNLTSTKTLTYKKR